MKNKQQQHNTSLKLSASGTTADGVDVSKLSKETLAMALKVKLGLS